jgi:tRNA threonylcarbamoyladenosine biosynthesis protein TsaB
VSVVLAYDTATPATVVGLRVDGAEPVERRHDPAPGERPAHAAALLPLANELLAAAGLAWPDVDRLGVGVGPGTFTGLRIGVATGRALAQATGAELVAISTLEALALGARSPAPDAPAAREQATSEGGPGARAVLAVVDARRGEAFAAAWAGAERLHAPAPVAPGALSGLIDPARGPWLAVGDGALRFRDQLEPAGIAVPADQSPLHRVGAWALCRLAGEALPVEREALLPDYVRAPDAEPRRPAGAP